GLGAQGDGRGPLGVPLRRGRPQVLPPLVLLGDALALDAHDREGADAQDAPPEHPHLPLPPDHQRDRRGPEFEDPMDPVHRPRLPQPGELQDRDLLPLRRPRPLPTLKPEEPNFCPRLSPAWPRRDGHLGSSRGYRLAGWVTRYD